MINIIEKGNIFEDKSEALVNPVNCVGVMGKGLAYQFKLNFPYNFLFYKANCNEGKVQLGKVLVFRTLSSVPKFIINLPTKHHWVDRSNYESIQDGLFDLYKIIKDYHIISIAIPAIGCGLGGLDWKIVKSMIISTLQSLDPKIIINIYELT